MVAEVGLQHEELLLEGVLSLGSVVVFDGLLPHAHELPFFELLEEAQLLDVVIRITLNEPLAERDELDGHVILVQGKTLARESVVAALEPLRVADDLQVVGVTIFLGVQVHENGLLFRFRIKEQLNVLI